MPLKKKRLDKQTMVHLSDEILFSNKGMSYNATKIHRENLNAYCLGKVNYMKKLQTLRFQIYDILERAKTIEI